MKKLYRPLLFLLGGLIGIWLTVRFLLPVGLPFLLGYGLSRLAQRPGEFLTRRATLPPWLASLLSVGGVFALFCGSFYLLGQILFVRLQELTGRLPQLLASMEAPTAELYDRLTGLADRLPDSLAPAVRQWLQELFAGGSVIAEQVSQWLLDLVGQVLSWLPGLFLFLLAALLSAYLFSSRTEMLRGLWRQHIPQTLQSRLRLGGRRLKKVLGSYVKAELRLCAMTFGILAVGLFFLRGFSGTALLIALGIALIDALPVFGSGTVLIPWAVIAFLRGNSGTALGLLLLYAVAAVARAFLEPKLLGKQMGLDPLLTLLCLYGGFRLFGILGMILTPILAMILKQLYSLFSPPSGEAS